VSLSRTGRVAGIVPAAGAGVRLGGGVPKAWRLLGGRPMVSYAVDLLSAACDLVVVAAPPGFDAPDVGATVVPGGATRSASVRLALALLDDDVEYVLVHDAARPFAPPSVVARVLDALRAGEQAVIPVLPVTDTLKRVVGTEVLATVDRSDLVAAQTPQAFRAAVLRQAHREGADATDDAALLESMGATVRTVPGDPRNLKLTVPHDLVLAEILVGP